MTACVDCGDPATGLWVNLDWPIRQTPEPVCYPCWHRRSNREPPEPDGECFRGREAAAYAAERMDEAWRIKRGWQGREG